MFDGSKLPCVTIDCFECKVYRSVQITLIHGTDRLTLVGES